MMHAPILHQNKTNSCVIFKNANRSDLSFSMESSSLSSSNDIISWGLPRGRVMKIIYGNSMLRYVGDMAWAV